MVVEVEAAAVVVAVEVALVAAAVVVVVALGAEMVVAEVSAFHCRCCGSCFSTSCPCHADLPTCTPALLVLVLQARLCTHAGL